MTFSVSLSFASTNTKVSNDQFNITKNVQQSSSLNTNLEDKSERQYSKLEASTEESNQPTKVGTDRRDLNDTNQWSEFIESYGDSQLVIGFNKGQSNNYNKLTDLVDKYDGKIDNKVSMGTDIIAAVVNVSSTMISSFTSDIQAMGVARYIEPNMKFQANFVPNDPYWMQQWGPAKIQADYAWDTTIGDHSVLVAVIDTGIDWDHPDLAANYVALGYDWVNDDSNPMDDNGHGTHCAGIIAAVINNSIGIAGLAQVRIMAEKGLNFYGEGYEDDLANAIIHAVDQGADILSNSWRGYGESVLIYDAVKYAYDHGVLVIAAAGNEATSIKPIPAGYDEVIAVTATDQNDNPAGFTNFGDWVELAAPGVDIYSTIWNDGYATMSGTSMACPHVSGVAALVWSQFPNRSRDWVRRWLKYTTDDLGAPGFDPYYGYGRINARKAIQQVPSAHDLLISSWEKPIYVEPGNTGVFNVTVLNFGDNNETSIEVQLIVDDTLVNSTIISSLLVGESDIATCYWTPTIEGLYNVTAYVVPALGETTVENNVVSACIYVGFPLKVFVLDSAGTDIAEIISTWQILNTNWYLFGSTMIYIDYTTLNKEGITYGDLVATDADVLIISCASDWQFTDSEIEAITHYVHEGHGLIATAGTFYYMVPNNSKLAPLFGLDETTTWYVGSTDLLHLQDPMHPLFVNVPNPYTFRNSQTTIPDDGQWDSNELVGGTYLALGHFQESAIVTFRGLVYISPLLEIIPAYYHFHLQLLYNAILWSEYQKPEHELIVSLECPSIVKPNKSVLLNATVQNIGLNNETNVELQILIDGGIADSVVIPELVNGSSHTLSHLWTPTVESVYNITAYAPPVVGEGFITNNYDTKLATVTSALAIGIIETHGETLHTEDLTNFYRDLGCIVEKTSMALTQGVINFYDMLIVGEDWSNTPWSSSEIAAVEAFINSKKAFIGIGDELAHSIQVIMQTYGINYTGMYGASGPTSNFDPNHPIMQDVNLIYASAPVNSLNVASPGYYIVNDTYNAYILIAGAEVEGKVLFMSDDFAADLHYYDNSIMFQNILDWVPIYEHDLAVRLDAPAFLQPGDSSVLSATVHNRGLNNETNVEFQLLINGAVVNSTLIYELPICTSYALSYVWTPVEGIYNITAYAPSVPDEEFIYNNVAVKFVSVRSIKYVLFDQTHGTDSIFSYSTWVASLTGRAYVVETHTSGPIMHSVLERYDVFVIPQAHSPYSLDELSAIQNFVFSGSGLLVIGDDNPSIYTDLTGFAGITWMSGGWSGITTDITPHPVTLGVASVYLSSPIAIMNVAGDAQDLVRDPGHNIVLTVSEQPCGKVIGFADEDSLWDYAMTQEDNLRLADNMIDWLAIPIRLEHDLAVSLDTPDSLLPSDSCLLNATVRNTGLNNETSVELRLLINGSVVHDVLIPELLVGASNTSSYSWTPSSEGIYNVTAYAPPVSGENRTSNNVVSRMVRVSYVSVALISEYSELSALTSILDPMGIGYDIYNDNRIYLYTEDLDLLRRYSTVIFYTDYRHITSNEYTALQSYLSLDGNLLITGFDSLVSDDLLRDIIRSATMGDNMGEPDLYVVEDTHPIMNGPYGSFPAGYHISGLSSDCDVVEADTLRNAVTVAELADGYDRIIATQTLLGGKVVFWNGVGTNDWTWNADCQAMFKNTIEWMTVRYEHDLEVILDAPDSLEIGNSCLLNATVRNRGLNNETNVELEILVDSLIVNSTGISELPIGASYTISYLWTPPTTGSYNITAYAPPVQNETLITNNREIRIVFVFLVPGTYVHISPISNTVKLGRTFTVTVNVLNVTTLKAWQINVTFNPTILNVRSMSLPSNHIFKGLNPSPFPQFIDNAQGTVFWACAIGLGAPVDHFDGSGVMCQIEFEAVGLGTSPIHLETEYIVRTKLITTGGATMPFTPIDGVADVVEYFAGNDIAVIDVTPSATEAYVGWIVNITVVVENEGNATEDFNVTAYYDNSTIETLPVTGLEPGTNTTLTFTWNTTGITPCQNYTIKAIADIVLGEIDTADNTCIDGTVKIKLLGDVNGDGVIDGSDVVIIIEAIPSYPGHPWWNPNCDLNNNGIVDGADLVIALENNGTHM